VSELPAQPNRISVALTEAIKRKFDVVMTKEREERLRQEKLEEER
jgi:hypothetical protein